MRRFIKDFLICFVVGLGLAWMFVWGLDLHYEATEKAPWSKPSAMEMTHGR
jgi:hypothetical protein